MQIQIDMAKCDNCMKDIPEDKLCIHEAYCYRNCSKCDKCGEMYDKKDPQQHSVQHEIIGCKDCDKQFERRFDQQHKDECLGKGLECEFCELPIKMKEFENHVISCGSRTQDCLFCKVPVILRNKGKHQCAEIVGSDSEPQLNSHPKVKARAIQKLKRKTSEDNYLQSVTDAIMKNRNGEFTRLQRKKQNNEKQKQQQPNKERILRKRQVKQTPAGRQLRPRTRKAGSSSTGQNAEDSYSSYKQQLSNLSDFIQDDSEQVQKKQDKTSPNFKKNKQKKNQSIDSGELRRLIRRTQQQDQMQQLKRVIELSKSQM